jgi:DNA (cytosine-5)-methyltransferase 1
MWLTHFSLFSGIGGIDLAAEWAGFQTVGQCELDDYCVKVLEKHWPAVPRWRDIRDVTADSVRDRGIDTVTVVSGGFPCQPFSVAGKRRGKEDDRFLWSEMLRVVSELRPAWVLGENVAGIVSLALNEVLSDLEGEGYEVQPFIIPACGVNAPHRRDRVFIVAWSSNRGHWNCGEISQMAQGQDTKPTRVREDVADTRSQRRQQKPRGTYGDEGEDEGRSSLYHYQSPGYGEGSGTGDVSDTECNRLEEPRFCGIPKGAAGTITDGSWWATEPDVGRVVNGLPHRVDRLRCLGNAVVPQQVYPILKAIAEIELAGTKHS